MESSPRTASRLISTCRPLAIAGAILLMVQTMSAATITFGSASDYDNNFYEVFNGSQISLTGGLLNKTGSGAATAIYNTAATGGSGGSGGTAGGLPLDKFASFTIQADYNPTFVSGGTQSFGFYTKIDNAGTTGYAALFRIVNSTTVDFRLFDSNGTLANSGVGTSLFSANITTTGSFLQGTLYRFKLIVTDVGSNVQFDASMSTTSGIQIGIVQSFTDTTSATTGLGQVGFRIGDGGRIDNFSITAAAVPEPGTSTVLAGGAALLFAGLLRRKRTSR